MAYLTFTSEEKQNTCFKFIGATTPSERTTHLISNNVSLLSSSFSSEGGNDTCSFYSGPSDTTIVAFGESCESAGSIAYLGSESCGSIAYTGGGESCGSVASASVSTSSSVGGGCSYSC